MPLKWSSRSRKDLRKLAQQDAARIVDAVGRYFDTGHGDVKKLQGFDPPRWRLRVGAYRAIFRQDGDAMLILRVRPRGDAY